MQGTSSVVPARSLARTTSRCGGYFPSHRDQRVEPCIRLRRKAIIALYKAAEIREYWVVDLKARQVHCFVAPQYRRQTLSDWISPEAWPDIRIELVELFA